MRRYALGLVVFAVLILVFGFMTEKITGNSFQSISFPGIFEATWKSLVVVLVLLLSITAALPCLLIDLVLAFFTNFDFPMLNQLKAVCWDSIAMDWFWNQSSGSSIFFAGIIVLGISSFLSKG